MSYAITKYLSVSFPGGVDVGELHVQVQKQKLASAELLSITANIDTDECIALFDVEPDPADKTEYDNIVSAYSWVNNYIDPALTLIINEHFMISNIASTYIGKNNWTKSKSLLSSIEKSMIPGHPGCVKLVVGEELNSFAAVHLGSTSEGLTFETGTYNTIECEFCVMFDGSLSSADFQRVLIGFSDDNDTYGSPQNAGVLYFDPSESLYLQMKTIVAGVETVIITSIQPVVDEWYKVTLRFTNLVTNPMMQIFINNVLEGQTNFVMPLTSTAFSPTIKADGKLGSSSIGVNVDYFLMREDYSYN